MNNKFASHDYVSSELNDPSVGSKRNAAIALEGNDDDEETTVVSGDDDIGRAVNETNFERTVNEVKAYVFKYNEFPRQKRIREDGDDEKRLLFFLNNQRQKKKLDKLSEERINLLESIPGFFWSMKERCPEQFEKTVSDLKDFAVR